MKNIFSVDVEDWFHILDIPSAPYISEWDSLPSHVEKNFMRLLDLLSEKNVKVTCFFLGYIAERFPHLVRESCDRGHEVASHGYAHRLVYELTQNEFYEDAVKSRLIIENISGKPVRGFRAAGFSVTEECTWFFDKLIEAGYEYDTSIFPAVRQHGGLQTNFFGPHRVKTTAGSIIELPITVTNILYKPICFFGGGYLRFFHYEIIKCMSKRVMKEGRPVIYYIHPRDIDTNQPRLPMSPIRQFKSYINIKSTESKLRAIMHDFEITTFEAFINDNSFSQKSAVAYV